MEYRKDLQFISRLFNYTFKSDIIIYIQLSDRIQFRNVQHFSISDITGIWPPEYRSFFEHLETGVKTTSKHV